MSRDSVTITMALKADFKKKKKINISEGKKQI